MLTKLTLDVFVKPEFLVEVFSMNVDNEDVIKTRLFADILKYMQAFSQLSMQGKLDMARKSAGVQDFITRLSDFTDYFNARGTQLTMSGFEGAGVAPGTEQSKISASDAVEQNKRTFLTAIASGQEFVPIVWSKALATQAGQALPPKYYNLPTTNPASPSKGSYPVGHTTWADNSALDTVALDKPDANLQRAKTQPQAPATGEFYRFAK